MSEQSDRPEEQTKNGTQVQGQQGLERLRPSNEDLDRIIAEHEKWLETKGEEGEPAKLAGTNLTQATFHKAKLQEADLSKTTLTGASFYHCDLQKADLEGAELFEAEFIETMLTGANFSQACLEYAEFVRTNLREANLQGAKSRGAFFIQSDLQEASLKHADLYEAHLEGANLQGADLSSPVGPVISGAKPTRTNLQWAHLQGANLQGASLIDADLREAQLQGAILLEAHLGGAYLQNAILSDADLRKAQFFEKANFEGAHLDGANLEGVNLKGVHLEGAHLDGANLERANLEGANLEGAHLGGARLYKARLKAANLTRADLQWAKAVGAHVREAKLTGARLDGASFLGADLTSAVLAGSPGSPKRGQGKGVPIVEDASLVATNFGMAKMMSVKLPAAMKGFADSLKNMEEASRNARAIYFSVIAVCTYALLTAATTKDVSLLLTQHNLNLPIVNVKVPVVLFFIAASTLGLLVFVYLHMYLAHLWRLSEKLPNVFPDGLPLEEKLYPWMLNLVIAQWRQKPNGWRFRYKTWLTFDHWRSWAAILLAWGLVPLTTGILAYRFLVRHDKTLSYFLAGVFTVSVLFSSAVYQRGRSTVRSEKVGRRRWIVVVLAMTALAGSLGATYLGVEGRLIWTTADLTGAKLSGAQLKDADVSGANLSDAEGLKPEPLDQACGNTETKLPSFLGDYMMKPCPERAK